MNKEKIETAQRLFIAVEMPPAVIAYAQDVQQYLKDLEICKARFTMPPEMHVTLKFIGSIPESEIAHIDEILKTVRTSLIQARTGAIGIFKSEVHINIAYLHIISLELENLALSIDRALRDIVAQEKRKFIAHVTLARIKQVYDREKFVEIINAIPAENIFFMLDRFLLKKSTLQSQGSTYQTIAEYYLN